MSGLVIVGVDGSKGSRDALRWAAGLATATHRRIRVLRAWQYPATAGIDLTRTSRLPSVDEMDRSMREGLARVVEEVLGPDVPVDLATARGDAAGALLRAARAARADLLALGSRGLGGFKGLLLGSVSRSLAEYSPCPVAIVRRYASLPAGRRGGRTILVGVDGSEGAARAVAWAADLAAALEADVVAVHAFEQAAQKLPAPRYLTLRTAAERALDRKWCDPLRRASVSYRPLVVDGDARSVLMEASEVERSGLVVVGSRGLGALSAVLLGSVANHLVQRSPVPVVVVPPTRP
jgi:nucleotide-binding universal stress UspA family protein